MTLSINTLGVAFAASLFAAPVFAESQSFDFVGFDQISITAGIEAVIVSGPEFSIVAEAQNTRILRKLDIEMRGDTLYIDRTSRLRDQVFDRNSQISLTITLPNLSEIIVSSGVDAQVSGQFGDDFSGYASRNASLKIEGLDAGTIDLSAASGASVDVTGSCRFLDVSASGAAAVGAEGLICETVGVSSSSGAFAAIFASEALDSSTSSGGSIDVYGAPAKTDISNSTGGNTNMQN